MTKPGCIGDCERDDGFLCPDDACRIEQGLVEPPAAWTAESLAPFRNEEPIWLDRFKINPAYLWREVDLAKVFADQARRQFAETKPGFVVFMERHHRDMMRLALKAVGPRPK